MKSPVPAFSNSLTALSNVLKKAEAHCKARNISPDVLLTARLFPDMLNLTRNVLIACDTAKGAAARLTETENPVFEDNETTFEELHARIKKTQEFMTSVPNEAFEDADNRTVLLKAGGQEFTFTGEKYMAVFATPNFYFHATTVYNILRHNGVELGKKDYLGG